MEGTQLVTGSGGSVLLLSMRRIARLVAFCVDYEFEDVIAEVTGADRVDVTDHTALEWSRRIYKYSRYIGGNRPARGSFAGFHSTLRLQRDYELFFPVFNHPHELFSLATVPDWRKRCKVAACFISELWLNQFPHYLLSLLEPFDHVFVGVRHPVAELSKLVGRPCTYLPLAADVLRFAPVSVDAERPIDMCNIGRRSQVTHASLLSLASQRRLFYYYDTVAASGIDMKHRTFRVQDAREHRMLLASLLQHSRYCFAHRGYINAPEFTQGRDEISSRVYEGAAAGVVMLGQPPAGEDFKQQFDWPDTLIPVPFDCPDIGRILAELDSDPGRLAQIRRNNVSNSAARHDWVYRLRKVFETLGLAATPAMQTREAQLLKISQEALRTP